MNDMQMNPAMTDSAQHLDPDADSDPGFDFVNMLVTMGERKKLIFKTTAIIAVLGVALNLLLPPVYTSKTVLMPPQQQKTGFGALAALGALSDLGGAIGVKTPDEMYVGLLKSDSISDDLIRRFNLKARYHKSLTPDAREKLASKVKISSDKKSGFVTVEASDKAPEFAAQLANAYVDELRKLLDRLAVTDAQQRRMFFQQQISATLQRLSNAEIAFDQARQKSGVVSLDGQVTNTIRESAALRARIAASEVQLQSMRTWATDENPDVQRSLAAIKAMREQLAQMERGGNASDDMNGQGDSAALANIRAYREVKYQEAILDEFRKQLELAQVDEAREGPLVQQVDVALPAEKKSGLKLWLVVVLSIVAGAAGGVTLALGHGALSANPELAGKLSRIRNAWRIRGGN